MNKELPALNLSLIIEPSYAGKSVEEMDWKEQREQCLELIEGVFVDYSHHVEYGQRDEQFNVMLTWTHPDYQDASS